MTTNSIHKSHTVPKSTAYPLTFTMIQLRVSGILSEYNNYLEVQIANSLIMKNKHVRTRKAFQ